MEKKEKTLLIENVVKFMLNRFTKQEAIKCFGKVMGVHFFDKWIGFNRDFAKWWCDLDCLYSDQFVDYVCNRCKYKDEELRISAKLERLLFTRCEVVIIKKWSIEKNVYMFNLRFYDFGFDYSQMYSGEYTETSVIVHNGELFTLKDWTIGQAEDVSFVAENDWVWNNKETIKIKGIPYIL